MDEVSERITTVAGRPRVAIVGNSNSVLLGSYARVLQGVAALDVVNCSIGATPNVVLLDFLVQKPELDYDFIVIETAVVDKLQSSRLYTRERSQETLELFIRLVQGKSNAQIIILMIPTLYGMLDPKSNWQETVYRDAATRFGLPVLDVFSLIRQLVGPEKMNSVALLFRRAERLVSAFGIPIFCAETIAWQGLREPSRPTNALGVFAFTDAAHVSFAMHMLLAALLRDFMLSHPVDRGHDRRSANVPATVKGSRPIGGEKVVRSSSLISRELVRLTPGETVRYKCDTGFRVYGLLVNHGGTSCILQLRSPAGTTTFDMRFSSAAFDWSAFVAAVLDPVGEGDIELSILDERDVTDGMHRIGGADATTYVPRAEVGDLLMVRADWDDVIPPANDAPDGSLHIEDQPWAQALIADAASRAERAIRGIEMQGRFFDKPSSQYVEGLLSRRNAPLTLADQARLMLAMGMMEQLPGFVEAACAERAGDTELERMRDALLAAKAEAAIRPGPMLDQALTLVRSGRLDESDAMLAEGMQLFPGEIGFPIESAWIPFRRHDWPEATRRWKYVRDAFPDHTIGYIGLSLCYKASRQFSEAEHVLADAVARFPDHEEAAVAFARLPLETNDLTAAERRLESARARFPRNRENRIAIVDLLIRQARFADARDTIHDLVTERASGPDLLFQATRLASSEAGLRAIEPVWGSLASSVEDRDRAAHESEKLFAKSHAIYNCDFLLTWMLSDAWPKRISQIPAVVRVLARSRVAAERDAVEAAVLRHLGLIADPLLRQVTFSILGRFTSAAQYADLIANVLDMASDEDLPEELFMILLGPGVANPALSGAVEAALAGLIDPAVELRQTKQSRIYLLLVAADRLFPDLAKALRSRLKAEREAGMMGRLSVLVHA